MNKRYILEQRLKDAEEYYNLVVYLNVPATMPAHEAWDEVYEAEQALYDYDLGDTEAIACRSYN